MNIMVIGNKSVIGDRLINKLKKKHNVYTMGRNKEADIFCDFLELKLPNLQSLNIDVIINTIATFNNNSIDGGIENEIINSIANILIVKLSKEVRCRHIINVDSIFTIENEENEHFNSYALSKKHGKENLIYFAELENIYVTNLMLAQVYDEYGKCRKNQFLFYNIIDEASKNSNIFLYGTRDSYRNYIFIQDVTNIIEKVIENQVYGTFYCTNPNSYKLSQIAHMAMEVYNSDAKVIFLEKKPNIKSVFIPKENGLYDLIKYTPRVDLLEGIKLIKDNLDK